MPRLTTILVGLDAIGNREVTCNLNEIGYLPDEMTDMVFPQSRDIQLIYSVPVKSTREEVLGDCRMLFTIPTFSPESSRAIKALR